MGLFGNILEALIINEPPQQQRKRTAEPPKIYTPDEYVIYEQERSGEKWHGVPLSELSKLAQTVYHGKYVKVDSYDFLVFHYTSNSNKTKYSVQCELDENGQLSRMTCCYYPGQWRVAVDVFVEKANQEFTFK